MYTHLELSSQWKLIHSRKKIKIKEPTILDVQNLVCGENKSVFVHAEVCIGLMWALNVYTDEHTATLDLCESSAQS